MRAMGRVLFVTWHGGGNVNPVVAIGQQLRELGHDVHVLGAASLAPRFAAADDERAGGSVDVHAFQTIVRAAL